MKQNPWAWLWFLIGTLYFIVPLVATIDFSLRAEKGKLSFKAYENIFTDPNFISSFTFSLVIAIATILLSWLLIVPTVYWVQLRLPRLRPVIELMTGASNGWGSKGWE